MRIFQDPMPLDVETLDDRIAQLRAILPVSSYDDQDAIIVELNAHLQWRKNVLGISRWSDR